MISIIVPVYNKEEYVESCIKSILNQTNQNFELILIDDGSTDDSYSIINKYACNYNNVRCYKTKNNGVSAARNYGISCAKGDRIVFVDADDKLEKDFIEKCEKYDEDFILTGYIKNEKMHKPQRFTTNNKEELLSYVLNIQNIDFIQGPCFKVFKTCVIKENKISFKENMNFGEDTVFVLNYIEKSVSLRVIDYAGYEIVLSKGSLSRSYVADSFQQMSYLYSQIKRIKLDNKKEENRIYTTWCFRCIKKYLYMEKNNDYFAFKSALKYARNFEDYSRLIRYIKNLGKKDCIIYLLMYFHIYFIVYWIYKYIK